MDLSAFRRVVTAFADEAVDVDLGKGRLVAQIRDEVIDATLLQKEGSIWVEERDREAIQAYHWIVTRLARLDQLADRLLNQLPNEPHFVDPTGHFLDDLDAVPDGVEKSLSDASQAIKNALNNALVGVTKVLYLTSDAGEGKTTLINQVARRLASDYKKRTTNWLLVPITLGGRPFMALDDIVVAELTNRFRFNLYYDAFTELVRLNAIVPALDGFEEVFMETGTGEAVSALGNLINLLGGSGRVLIAARKAYFEVRSFASQARIFDTIGTDAGASFERLSLNRWSKAKFCEYANKRGLSNPELIHDQISERLRDKNHPLLTRAVLVGRLIDVALEGDIESLLTSLAQDPEDYFFQFVGALIEREATTKWIDRSRRGDAASPLLTIEEHLSLLTQIAREMWVNQTDSLRADYIELVSDMFSTEHNKPAIIANQIHERLHQHSLLTTRGTGAKKIGFDHEDFRLFFLGQALGTEFIAADTRTLGTFLSVAVIPERTADAAISYVTRNKGDYRRMLGALENCANVALDTSYEKENVGGLIVRLLEKSSLRDVEIDKVHFPPEALQGRTIEDVVFRDCRFHQTAVDVASLRNVRFFNCYFERLELLPASENPGVIFEECSISSLLLLEKDEAFYNPDEIQRILRDARLCREPEVSSKRDSGHEISIDDNTRIAEQALRAFMRATHLNENVFRQRLGKNAPTFFDAILPHLLSDGILEEVDYRGSGAQRRFKLLTPMRNIEPAIKTATTMSDFVMHLKSPPRAD